MCFTDVVARWPGSTHDSFVLRYSGIKQQFEDGKYGDSIILGDSGYPLTSWLMTPISEPKSPAEERYNRAHKKTRVLIERLTIYVFTKSIYTYS